jgi:membrane protein
MSPSSPADAPPASYEAAVQRLPPALRSKVERLMAGWPGRTLLRVVAATARIELFDRSMTIAAQFFTSIFPILIALAAWVGGVGELIDAAGVPQETQQLLDEALNTGSNEAAFGALGMVLVLASATSLSRALTRAFAAMWELPRPVTRLTAAWRWVAVVMALALALVAARGLTRLAAGLPPPTFWQALTSAACDVAVAVFVPWVLMGSQIRPRHLLPGAVLFAGAMVFLRPTSKVWLPHALEVSAERYGTIGVAFTYLAWLYVLSFCFLAAGVIGQVLTTDAGWLGRRLRGRDVTAKGEV